MGKNNNLTDFLTDVANAIREKKGSSDPINPQNFSDEIASIETGGGDTPTPDMPVIGDGKTYLYIKIAEKGRMTVPLRFSQTVANGVVIDWGDNSDTQTLSGTGNRDTSHTYAEAGEYTISLTPSNGCILGLGHKSSSYCVMGSTGSSGKVYSNMLQAVEIGQYVESVDNYAFYNCFSLASVVIPEGVTSIGNYAFQNCYSLASVVIPEGVTSIGNYAFTECYSLASVVIPEGVTSIGNYAFSNCRSLASVVIPESVTSISGDVFSSCYSLASIVIPEGVTSIGSSMFYNCYSLASVVIPGGVTSIGSSMFYNCSSLASVVIPGSVTSIGSNAFQSCAGVAYYDFTQCASVPTLGGTTVFSGIASGCKMVVPDNLYDEWIAATNWSNYAKHIIKTSDYNPKS